MSSTAPMEISASAVIERIESGEYPREVVLTIARGFLPLPQEDLVTVLSYLTTTRDDDVVTAARIALSEIPARVLHDIASNERLPPDHLALIVRALDDPQVLEALIRNRAVSDEVVANLALRADAAVQEVIVINQARILRAPQILDALLANPRLSAETKRRALETREEFFEKRRPQQPAEAPRADAEPAFVEVDESSIADLLAKAEADEAAAAQDTVPELTESEQKDPEKLSVFQAVLKMTVAQKVQFAFRTDKTGRMLLVRDRNRLVCSAVMRNPRITENEVEQVAGMRNVDDEVLRLITTRRDWMSKYPIVIQLVRNPKVPIALVLPLINRLTLRDLKGLKDDKGVPEVVRAIAKKFYVHRQHKA